MAVSAGKCPWRGKPRWRLSQVRPMAEAELFVTAKIYGRSLEDGMPLDHSRTALMLRLLLLMIILPFTACRNSEQPGKPSISVFASPDDAGNAVMAAAKSGDQNALLAIFGPDSKQLIYSGDAVQDKNAAAAFVARYAVMHRWRKLADGAQVLLVGADNSLFLFR